ncbi:MAG: GntR family transcriptional regulator [Planctomycetota bacterium]
MKFHCDPASRSPMYRQLMEQVREGVATGRLAPGERLPSVRQLSRELVVNPNTVARAYSELERDGVIHTRQGLGAFVAERTSDTTKRARRERLVDGLDRLLTEAVHLGFTEDEVRAALDERLGRFRFDE